MKAIPTGALEANACSSPSLHGSIRSERQLYAILRALGMVQMFTLKLQFYNIGWLLAL
jgi:hypothetical protein